MQLELLLLPSVSPMIGSSPLFAEQPMVGTNATAVSERCPMGYRKPTAK